jgi:hypothetical protein
MKAAQSPLDMLDALAAEIRSLMEAVKSVDAGGIRPFGAVRMTAGLDGIRADQVPVCLSSSLT